MDAACQPGRFDVASAHSTGDRREQGNGRVPDYERVSTLSSKVFSVGSPTTNAMISAWAEEFKKIYPGIEFDLKGGNSVAVLPALLSKNPPNLGSMSRPMSDEELAAFKKRF